jgi:hypothetical protein
MSAQPQSQSKNNPTSGVVALVMGILGLTALPLIGSILALVFGAQSRNEVANNPRYYSDDLGRIGRILGWVGLALTALGVLVVVLFFAVLFSF